MTGLVIIVIGWPVFFAGQLIIDRALGWPLADAFGKEE